MIDDQILKAEHDGVVLDGQALPAERTLQDALRTVLSETSTGVSDDAAGKHGLVYVQSEDVLLKLKKTDTFNRRKMNDFRDALIAGTVETNSSNLSAVMATNSAVSEALSSNLDLGDKSEDRFQKKRCWHKL